VNNFVDDLAQEIRRVDGENKLGAGALAEALMPFLKSNADIREPQIKTKWRASDLENGKGYESIYFGLVIYRGVDRYYGQKTHKFEVGRSDYRYWSTDKLGEFLKPKEVSSDNLD